MRGKEKRVTVSWAQAQEEEEGGGSRAAVTGSQPVLASALASCESRQKKCCPGLFSLGNRTDI